MKNIIKKFWGVALVVMLLSTILMLPAAPAAAAAYAFSDTAILPSAVTGVLAPTVGFGFVAVAQAGDVIYGTATDAGAVDYLYKSADGGATWAACLATGLVAGTWNLVTVAPDDPNYVVVVDTAPATDVVWLSTNGGASFQNISATIAAGAALDSIDISALYGGYHTILIGGIQAGPAAYLAKWQIALAATWTNVPTNVPACVPNPTEIQAVKFTPNPDIDQAYFFIGKTATDLSLHIYSDAFLTIDPAGFNYPRVFATGAAVACTKAVIVLDENFLLYDNEVGFVGANVAGGAPAVTGGVWSLAGGAIAQIQTLATINSIAWDGTNMMSAGTPGGVLAVYRSANALAGAGVTVFYGNAPFKGPAAGTCTNPNVFFAGGAAYCVSQGEDSAVAMSTDLGKTFNGVALIASTFNNPFNNVLDFWIKADGSVIYALTNDNAAGDVDLWRYASAAWQRILVLDAALYGTVEIVRSAQSNTNAIYVARPTNNNRIIKSVDGGTTWILRSCTQAIADLAVQSATVAYVAGAATVVKTANGCTSWTTVGALTAGAGYSINLLADNSYVVGGTTGYVGYYDGTAWTAITVRVANGPAVVTASGTATGDVIFSGTAAANGLGFWTIGTSTALTGWTADAGAPAVTGLSFANGILYAFDDAANNLYRYYMPSIGLTLWKDTQATAGTFNGANTINSLQMVAGSNILWARDASTNPDTLQSYTEYLLAATPAGTYPVNNVIIPVNSLNGMTSPFLFQWTAPAVTAPLAGWTYNVFVYYDAAGLIMIGGPYAAGGVTNLPAPAGLIALLNPGDTYYWQVQIVTPIHSGMSPMQSFTVQQLQAIVPVIHTPVNGVMLDTLSPGFSWAPISGVTSYQFQLSKEPSFVVLVYSDNTTTAGESLPVALKLVAGTQYFWRVRAATPAVGDWSEVGNFSIAVPTPTPSATPPVTPPTVTATATVLTTPTVTVILPTTTQATVEKISPAYIWAIIIIGAVLVIAVIVLIVRTRRTV